MKNSPLPPKMRRHLMRGGYEQAERRLVRQLVREGDRVIELGASLGILTSILCKRVGPTGKVVAVEANAALAEAFHRQLRVNDVHAPLVHALGCPLWDAPVPEAVRKRGFSTADSTLSGRAGEAGGASVPWRNLAEIAAEGELTSPTVLVVDVEGGEEVWCDLRPNLPPSVRLVIVEIHPHLIGEAKAGGSVQAILQEGFEIAGISGTVFGLER